MHLPCTKLSFTHAFRTRTPSEPGLLESLELMGEGRQTRYPSRTRTPLTRLDDETEIGEENGRCTRDARETTTSEPLAVVVRRTRSLRGKNFLVESSTNHTQWSARLVVLPRPRSLASRCVSEVVSTSTIVLARGRLAQRIRPGDLCRRNHFMFDLRCDLRHLSSQPLRKSAAIVGSRPI